MRLSQLKLNEDIRVIDPIDIKRDDGSYDFTALLDWIMATPSLPFELRGHREYVGSALLGATTTLRKFVNKHAVKQRYKTCPIKNLYGYDNEFRAVISLLRNRLGWEKDTLVRFHLTPY